MGSVHGHAAAKFILSHPPPSPLLTRPLSGYHGGGAGGDALKARQAKALQPPPPPTMLTVVRSKYGRGSNPSINTEATFCNQFCCSYFLLLLLLFYFLRIILGIKGTGKDH